MGQCCEEFRSKLDQNSFTNSHGVSLDQSFMSQVDLKELHFPV